MTQQALGTEKYEVWCAPRGYEPGALTRKKVDELTEMRATSQCLAELQHGAQQPRLTTEADVEPDTKTRKRTENAAADQAKNSSARVD
ncbi:unnamed protein product, partial [Ascophyllum nodosum]